MLYITRSIGESFYLSLSPDVDPNMKVRDLIPEPIRIEYTRKSGGEVMFGIQAPRVFSIKREEIYGKDKSLRIEIHDAAEDVEQE